MASDYKKIVEEHEKRYGWDAKPRRIYKRLYSNKTHFVYELIQNADDSKSQHLELQLDSNTLFVWNDGRQFNERDVRSICSLGSSDKDLTHIGTFGIGFKAVYNYTDYPEIYSGDERFRIRDFIKPEGIDEMTQEVEKLVNEGKTVFRLPFKNSLHQESDIEHLKDRLCDLSKERSLLFLRHLKKVEWKDERNTQTGSYSCHRYPYDRIQNIPENECVKLVELTGTLNGNDKPSETFLVFRKKIHPPKDVIDKLLEQAEDEEEQQSIQQSADQLQPIEVAFKLQDDRITAMDDNCVLFAYLPTQKETHLKFLIQARYQTTPARDNIPEPSENPWNRWLVQETADFFPEILEQLKAEGLLEPAFFNVLPLKRDVENEFKPIAEALQKAMQKRAFVPTQNGGYAKVGSVFHVNSKGIAILRGAGYRYAKAENVYYPHAEIMRQLIENNWLHSNSCWLHPEIRETDEFRQCFKVMQEADVKTVGVSRVLGWLEGRDPGWFEAKSNEWLRSLYAYLKEQKSHLGRIKNLPLVRLENGMHVCASYESVFFPPEVNEACNDNIKYLLKDLPILQSALLEAEERNEIEAFLKSLGVKALYPSDLIREAICPQYCRSEKLSIDQNRQHVRYIFKVWRKCSASERSSLKVELSETPFLRVYGGIQREISDFVIPREAYLPKAYTDDANLETYFSVYNGDIWFVDDTYLEDNSDAEDWLRFLKAIGSMDTPRVIQYKIPLMEENRQEFNNALDKRGIKSERTTSLSRTSIKDFCPQGLLKALNKIDRHGETDISQAIWSLLVKMVKPLPSEERQRNTFFRNFFQGTYCWFYYKDRWKSFNATFYRQLKSTPWIPDEQGNLHTPSECFVPTSENRKLLGDSVVYLPADFDISTGPAKWLAEQLGVHMEADTESVLNHLQKLRSDKEVSIEKVKPLYRFLYGARPRKKVDGTYSSYTVDPEPSWRLKFREEPLIFIPDSKLCWWRVDAVFWEDESVVFDNDCGYLEAHYAKDLKSFFTTSLAVSERATASDYVDRIHRAKSMEQTTSEKIRILYERLWQVMQESSVFSNRLDVHPRKKFKKEPLIFTSNPEPRWWRADGVFWEDEGVVFGDDRGYLKAYYPETLKPFFTALGISERAAPLDYVHGIQEIASVEQVGDSKVRKRVNILYRRLWQSLQEGGGWQEAEEWKQIRKGRCWLGKKGDKWDFFSRDELVWNDHHDYVAEIFEGGVPFWAFASDLSELARNLEIEGCSQAKIEFHPEGDQEEYRDLSEKVRNLRPYIHAFLNSPRLCEAHEAGRFAHVLDRLSVRLVVELETTYTLKEVSLTASNPRPSFLDVTDQEVILWLALEADKDDYALFIGDALQDYFGAKDLGRFTEHLLTKNRDKVLSHWERDGLLTELCMPPEADAKESEERPLKTVDEKLSGETTDGNVHPVVNESNVETPTDSAMPKTDGEGNDSVTDETGKSVTRLSSDKHNDSAADESEVELPIDSETPEIDKSDNNSTSDKSETDTDSPSNIGDISSPGTRTSTETKSVITQPTDRESEHETPTVNERAEVGNGGVNLTTDGSGTRTYTPSGTSGTSRSGGHSISTSSSRGSRGGGHGGTGGGGEGSEHQELKENLAADPSQLDVGLKLLAIEYTFKSGDRVDILLEDGSENPVTVEVETGFSFGAGRYVGVWQAVKYKHLAAVEYSLPCEKVRSILAAPEIPDDVKTECEKLGIEPIEVPD